MRTVLGYVLKSEVKIFRKIEIFRGIFLGLRGLLLMLKNKTRPIHFGGLFFLSL